MNSNSKHDVTNMSNTVMPYNNDYNDVTFMTRNNNTISDETLTHSVLKIDNSNKLLM